MPDRRTVHVIGNCMVDIGLALPHLPRPGETLIGAGGARAPGGKAVNQAVAAARAGARVRLCTPLGDDGMAAEVRAALAREPLAELDAPATPGTSNDFALLLVLPGGENATVGTVNCAHALLPGHAARFAAAAIPGDLVLVQGNLTAATTMAILDAAPPGAVVYNPSPIVWDAGPVLARAGIVIANEIEAEILTGEADPARAATALSATIPLVVVTLGARGCLAASAGQVAHHPAPTIVATDTSGCGDVFCGVFAAGLAAGAAPEDAILRAQAAAALAATRPGAFLSIPRGDEMP